MMLSEVLYEAVEALSTLDTVRLCSLEIRASALFRQVFAFSAFIEEPHRLLEKKEIFRKLLDQTGRNLQLLHLLHKRNSGDSWEL
jgi:hypothetical protein